MITNQTAIVVNVTPAIAQEWLELYPYSGQRRLRNNRVKRLASEMEKGRFTGNTIEVVQVNGRGYLANGQHTLKAIIQYGGTIPLILVQKEANLERDVDIEYSHTDIQLVRTQSDRFNALKIHENIGLSASITGKFASALAIILSGFSIKTPPPVDDVAEAVLNWRDTIGHVYGCLNIANIQLFTKLMRRDMLSVFLAIGHYADNHLATSFMQGIASGLNLVENDPRLYLRNFAVTSKTRGGTAGSQSISTAYGIRYAALCWKHYHAGTFPKVIKVYSEYSPIFIAGTPFK